MNATEVLSDIASIVKARVDGRGFALFIMTGEKTASYASTVERSYAVRLLKEWLENGKATWAGAMRETGQMMLDRMKQAEVCAEIGEEIASTGAGVILFVFDLGSGARSAGSRTWRRGVRARGLRIG